jgi:hypothetical protein
MTARASALVGVFERPRVSTGAAAKAYVLTGTNPETG